MHSVVAFFSISSLLPFIGGSLLHAGLISLIAAALSIASREAPSTVYLNCAPKKKDNVIEHNITSFIHSRVVELPESLVRVICPYTITKDGPHYFNNHSLSCSGSVYSGRKYCFFRMQNVLITAKGAIIEPQTMQVVNLAPDLIDDPRTHRTKVTSFLEQEALGFIHAHPRVRSDYDANTMEWTRVERTVILTRFIFDHFTHSSFYLTPLVGLVQKMFPSAWQQRQLMWHASADNAVLLELAGVPAEHILVEQTIVAHDAVLLWKPRWSGSSLLGVGIAHEVNQEITKNLLALRFPAEVEDAVPPLKIWSPPNITSMPDLPADKRYVVYLRRPPKGNRGVENDQELIGRLQEALQPMTHLQLVIVGGVGDEISKTELSNEKQHIELSHQNYARILARARVLISPHGGALNNMIFAPDDCDVIEFNTNLNRGRTRLIFVFASWARMRSDETNSRHYTVVSPTNFNETISFYNIDPMHIDVDDVIEVLRMTNAATSAQSQAQ